MLLLMLAVFVVAVVRFCPFDPAVCVVVVYVVVIFAYDSLVLGVVLSWLVLIVLLFILV